MQKKPIPQELFLFFGKLLPMVAVELVVAKRKQILLTRRPKDDPYWPSMWHVPGGYIWYREPIQHALKRIAKRELGVSLKATQFLGVLEFYQEKENPRTHTVSLVFRCTPTEPPKEGKFFLATELPENFITMQQRIVNLFLEKT